MGPGEEGGRGLNTSSRDLGDLGAILEDVSSKMVLLGLSWYHVATHLANFAKDVLSDVGERHRLGKLGAGAPLRSPSWSSVRSEVKRPPNFNQFLPTWVHFLKN